MRGTDLMDSIEEIPCLKAVNDRVAACRKLAYPFSGIHPRQENGSAQLYGLSESIKP